VNNKKQEQYKLLDVLGAGQGLRAVIMCKVWVMNNENQIFGFGPTSLSEEFGESPVAGHQ